MISQNIARDNKGVMIQRYSTCVEIINICTALASSLHATWLLLHFIMNDHEQSQSSDRHSVIHVGSAGSQRFGSQGGNLPLTILTPV